MTCCINLLKLQPAGRGSRMGGGEPADYSPAVEQGGGLVGAGAGAPDGAAGADRGRGGGGGNGGVRGRGSFRNEIIFTRPQTLQTKQGKDKVSQNNFNKCFTNFQEHRGHPYHFCVIISNYWKRANGA